MNHERGTAFACCFISRRTRVTTKTDNNIDLATFDDLFHMRDGLQELQRKPDGIKVWSPRKRQALDHLELIAALRHESGFEAFGGSKCIDASIRFNCADVVSQGQQRVDVPGRASSGE